MGESLEREGPRLHVFTIDASEAQPSSKNIHPGRSGHPHRRFLASAGRQRDSFDCFLFCWNMDGGAGVNQFSTNPRGKKRAIGVGDMIPLQDITGSM